MFEIKDTAAGLTVTMIREPEPRNPRMADENLFQIVTWIPDLGDAHDWPNEQAFLASINHEETVMMPLTTILIRGRHALVPAYKDTDRVVGYAFASFESICLFNKMGKITDEVRSRVLENAEYTCLGELSAYEEFIAGDVHMYHVVDKRGELLEEERNICGSEYAMSKAKDAFQRHLYGIQMDL
ncbi:hypothetical protein [Palleronia caenipelagi]|uniref:Uncharacterized protein n=1 Tax=Palleronia caenipelagi TaxID=2489174 RepID=A0A547PLC1_9RHOB|nr:hypothetical protein [Palleronia caenipelagi]TRD14903.1 hypothetical protein FEV53_18085 [Palleronia caenipelagi]